MAIINDKGSGGSGKVLLSVGPKVPEMLVVWDRADANGRFPLWASDRPVPPSVEITLNVFQRKRVHPTTKRAEAEMALLRAKNLATMRAKRGAGRLDLLPMAASSYKLARCAEGTRTIDGVERGRGRVKEERGIQVIVSCSEQVEETNRIGLQSWISSEIGAPQGQAEPWI
jgi:hypothetical protein